MIEPLILAGRLTNTHGIKGQLKADVYLDSIDYLKTFKRIVINGKDFKLTSVGNAGTLAIVKIAGIDDINTAMEYKGKEFSVYREDAHLEEGSFFLQDVIGFKVVDQNGNEIGRVKDVFENPAHPIFVVSGKSEHMIPAIPEFIMSTDFEMSVITINMIEGL